jgi:mitochondrial carrier
LAPKLVGNILSTHLSDSFADQIGVVRIDDEEKDDITEEEYYKRFKGQLRRNVTVHTLGAIISSPFHVISIRMMAQFVGREVKYSSIFGSILQIYKDEGISGFFSGFIPRLLFDISCVVIASTATYLVGRHFIREKEGRAYFGSLSSVILHIYIFDNNYNNIVSVCLHEHLLSFERRFHMHGCQWIRVSLFI